MRGKGYEVQVGYGNEAGSAAFSTAAPMRRCFAPTPDPRRPRRGCRPAGCGARVRGPGPACLTNRRRGRGRQRPGRRIAVRRVRGSARRAAGRRRSTGGWSSRPGGRPRGPLVHFAEITVPPRFVPAQGVVVPLARRTGFGGARPWSVCLMERSRAPAVAQPAGFAAVGRGEMGRRARVGPRLRLVCRANIKERPGISRAAVSTPRGAASFEPSGAHPVPPWGLDGRCPSAAGRSGRACRLVPRRRGDAERPVRGRYPSAPNVTVGGPPSSCGAAAALPLRLRRQSRGITPTSAGMGTGGRWPLADGDLPGRACACPPVRLISAAGRPATGRGWPSSSRTPRGPLPSGEGDPHGAVGPRLASGADRLPWHLVSALFVGGVDRLARPRWRPLAGAYSAALMHANLARIPRAGASIAPANVARRRTALGNRGNLPIRGH